MSDFIEIAFWVIAASAVAFILPGLFALARALRPPKVPPLPKDLLYLDAMWAEAQERSDAEWRRMYEAWKAAHPPSQPSGE